MSSNDQRARDSDARAILDRADKILARSGLAIVAIEIEVGAFTKPLCADHRCHHTDNLGALVIDGRRVEV